jgi:hypothetical protein
MKAIGLRSCRAALALCAATLLAGCGMGPPRSSADAPAASVTSGSAKAAPVQTLRPVASFASISEPQARSMALFQEAGKVIMDPRCQNCHPKNDRPLQNSNMQPHQPLVLRGPDGFGAVGMRCTTCHGSQNFDATPTSSVPGSKTWHLAPKEMAWVGSSLGQICTQLKDTRRNGGKSLQQIVDHMAHDELVGWGWSPGAGRRPVAGTQAEFGALMQAWADAGAHCPA